MEIDRLESSGDDFFERVYKGYHKIAELDPIRVKLIDATQSIDQIKSQIWEFVTNKMNFK
jgi:dTMP kinase